MAIDLAPHLNLRRSSRLSTGPPPSPRALRAIKRDAEPQPCGTRKRKRKENYMSVAADDDAQISKRPRRRGPPVELPSGHRTRKGKARQPDAAPVKQESRHSSRHRPAASSAPSAVAVPHTPPLEAHTPLLDQDPLVSSESSTSAPSSSSPAILPPVPRPSSPSPLASSSVLESAAAPPTETSVDNAASPDPTAASESVREPADAPPSESISAAVIDPVLLAPAPSAPSNPRSLLERLSVAPLEEDENPPVELQDNDDHVETQSSAPLSLQVQPPPRPGSPFQGLEPPSQGHVEPQIPVPEPQLPAQGDLLPELQLQPQDEAHRQSQEAEPVREYRERESSIWKVACQERVDVLVRRLGAPSIRAFEAAYSPPPSPSHWDESPRKRRRSTEGAEDSQFKLYTPESYRRRTARREACRTGSVDADAEDADAEGEPDPDIPFDIFAADVSARAATEEPYEFNSDEELELDLDDDMCDDDESDTTGDDEAGWSFFAPSAPAPPPADIPRLSALPATLLAEQREGAYMGRGTPPDRARRAAWACAGRWFAEQFHAPSAPTFFGSPAPPPVGVHAPSSVFPVPPPTFSTPPPVFGTPSPAFGAPPLAMPMDMDMLDMPSPGGWSAFLQSFLGPLPLPMAVDGCIHPGPGVGAMNGGGAMNMGGHGDAHAHGGQGDAWMHPPEMVDVPVGVGIGRESTLSSALG